MREEWNEGGDRRRLKVAVSAQQEPFELPGDCNLAKNHSALAKIRGDDEGFWIYHKNKVDLTTMFSQPDEKLWLVVKHYNGSLDACPMQVFDGNKGIKLEKNSVIKMGRVRLRVRDIDYADDKPLKQVQLSALSQQAVST